jgi:hypothetical protein
MMVHLDMLGSPQEGHLAKWCQPTGSTAWRQSRYAEDNGVHPTSGIDCLKTDMLEADKKSQGEHFQSNILKKHYSGEHSDSNVKGNISRIKDLNRPV